MNPFAYLTAINDSKENIMVDDLAEKEYRSFLVNRGLSYFVDTVLLANEMNIHHNVDRKLQFDFLLNSVRKRKRFSKWLKPEQNANVELVKARWGYNDEKARAALTLLSESQINSLRASAERGGVGRKVNC